MTEPSAQISDTKKMHALWNDKIDGFRIHANHKSTHGVSPGIKPLSCAAAAVAEDRFSLSSLPIYRKV